jgi:integrase
VRTFLDAIEGDRMAPAYRLLATTGMRRGEVLGLHWANVDLDKARIVVNRSLTLVNEELVWAPPKTARSRRSLSLDSETVAVLRSHRRRQLEERLNAGEAWHDNDLVFCNEDGTALHPSRFTRRFVTACERAGVPRIRLHDLRHTWATLALQAGIHPNVVSERLGHATTSITLDIYSHVQPELSAHAATAVAELFGDKSASGTSSRGS